jgi:hypothetical protein
MKRAKLLVPISLGVALLACQRQPNLDDIPQGRQVVVKTDDGRLVAGRLVDTQKDSVVLERHDGGQTSVERAKVASVALDGEPGDGSGEPRTGSGETAVPFREVVVPAGSVLHVTLDAPVASDSSRVEDRVTASLARPVTADGTAVLPAGCRLSGVVTSAERAGKVKGRAHVAFRFESLSLPDGGERLQIDTRPVVVVAKSGTSEDAKTIGIPAAAGAIIGGILGGGSGAAKGAAIGGGAGTAVVLSTRGDEVRLNEGAPVDVKLDHELTFQVPTAG